LSGVCLHLVGWGAGKEGEVVFAIPWTWVTTLPFGFRVDFMELSVEASIVDIYPPYMVGSPDPRSVIPLAGNTIAKPAIIAGNREP